MCDAIQSPTSDQPTGWYALICAVNRQTAAAQEAADFQEVMKGSQQAAAPVPPRALPAFYHSASPFGGIFPPWHPFHCGTCVSTQAPAETAGTDPQAAELKARLEGVFADVPEEEIEPADSFYFWRRPPEPPSIAWHSKLALAEALRKEGLNPRDFAVSYWEMKGEWPGGYMILPYITVVTPDGKKVDLSAEWTARAPETAMMSLRQVIFGEST
jgi:hypothetical protein